MDCCRRHGDLALGGIYPQDRRSYAQGTTLAYLAPSCRFESGMSTTSFPKALKLLLILAFFPSILIRSQEALANWLPLEFCKVWLSIVGKPRETGALLLLLHLSSKSAGHYLYLLPSP
jgi:hypothetical protein